MQPNLDSDCGSKTAQTLLKTLKGCSLDCGSTFSTELVWLRDKIWDLKAFSTVEQGQTDIFESFLSSALYSPSI